MTDHIQQLIQVEDERVETMLRTLAWESSEAGWSVAKLSGQSTQFAFIENAFNQLKHHLTRRDTLRELLNK